MISLKVSNHEKHRLVSVEYRLNEKAQIRTILLTFSEAEYLKGLLEKAIAMTDVPH
jgi:hypothetical protein